MPTLDPDGEIPPLNCLGWTAILQSLPLLQDDVFRCRSFRMTITLAHAQLRK